jgi:cell pole-organizing protein PopZ
MGSSSSSPALEKTMVETATSQEPTMEEILESIRKIISEEDDPAAAEQAAAPAAEEEVLELVDLIEEEEEEEGEEESLQPAAEEEAQEEDMEEEAEDASAADAPVVERAEPPTMPFLADGDDEELIKLVSERTADAGVAAFTDLARAVHGPWPLGDEDKTVEGMVLALLKPLLKEWLDLHLPGLVEELVRHEIERMVRRARPDIFKK